MQNYTLNQEIVDKSNQKPVLLTFNSDQSHVLMSVEIYQQLIK
jgi:PHD/YefM family antitoxin component YafN of YafNO toxin-antitoxin module